MSGQSVSRGKGKICLVWLENKRSLNLSAADGVIRNLAKFGYYFDKFMRASFNQPDEIVRALVDGLDNYENLVIFCPYAMKKTVAKFVCKKTGGQFDGLGIQDGKVTVFILFSDVDNRLTYGDIKNGLDKKYGVKYDSTVIRAVGAPQKLIDDAIIGAKEILKDGGHFNVTDSYGDCRIEVVYSSQTSKMQLDEAVRTIVKKLGEFVYAVEDISLAEQLFNLLKLRRMKLCVAESFTGGGVCKRLVEVSGISEVFFEGLNTYSNKSKMDRLGVSELTLNQRGAVSAETAYQMAEGLLKTGNCEVAISTTGIAGPKSDNTAKPVGLAYIAVGVADDIAVYKFNFAGNRETVTQTAINQALFLAYKRLK